MEILDKIRYLLYIEVQQNIFALNKLYFVEIFSVWKFRFFFAEILFYGNFMSVQSSYKSNFLKFLNFGFSHFRSKKVSFSFNSRGPIWPEISSIFLLFYWHECPAGLWGLTKVVYFGVVQIHRSGNFI